VTQLFRPEVAPDHRLEALHGAAAKEQGRIPEIEEIVLPVDVAVDETVSSPMR
jgi:hypothetical protein